MGLRVQHLRTLTASNVAALTDLWCGVVWCGVVWLITSVALWCLQLEPGSVPECPETANPMQIGRYFDLRGVEFRPPSTQGSARRGIGLFWV